MTRPEERKQARKRRSARNGEADPEKDGSGVHGSVVTGLLRSLLAHAPWAEKAESQETRSYPTPPANVCRVHNSNGVTRISGEDRDDVEVTVHRTARAESAEAAQRLLGDIQLVFSEAEGRLDLEVENPRKWNRSGTANLCIKLPRKMEVWVASANGRVEVEGIRGLVRARSTNGSARVSNVIGDVEVATTNAKVTCSCICGRLLARSSNGKIEIDEHRGSVDASTSNGLIRAVVEDLGEAGVVLATSNGRIVLDLPDAVDADVDLRVDNGIIRNDRPLCQKGRKTHRRILGRIGTGGVPIKLRTSNGSISLH